MNAGSEGGGVCCGPSPAVLSTWLFPGSCSYMDYGPRRDLSGHPSRKMEITETTSMISPSNCSMKKGKNKIPCRYPVISHETKA